jgi:methionine-rich copper-binding protein CopC
MRYLAAALLLTLGPAPALAHAFLAHASPSVGSVLASAPPALLLSYTEGVEVPFCKVTVTDDAGKNVAGPPQPVPGHADEISVPLRITAPGKYLVTWHAVSVDTHRTEGSFAFTVAP